MPHLMGSAYRLSGVLQVGGSTDEATGLSDEAVREALAKAEVCTITYSRIVEAGVH